MRIPFNKSYFSEHEKIHVNEVLSSNKLSGNGMYTNLCQEFMQKKYGFRKCLLTTSCTDALEMAAILIGIKEGDEVIVPSYTFVSTANAFILRGAKIVFADSYSDSPCLDADKIELLITKRTVAIVPVHYAGIACDMDKIMSIAEQYSLFVIEDAAQAIDSFYIGKAGVSALGSIGHLSAFSFHETKNITSGEGGMLCINDLQFEKRAEIIWEKGTNRSSFSRGEIDKYEWVDIGSSYLTSEILASILWGQFQRIDEIQIRRKKLWECYYNVLSKSMHNKNFKLPYIPSYATINGHIFYIVCNSEAFRDKLINHLKENQIMSVFHYQSLHKSAYFKNKYKGEELKNADDFSNCLLRLPMFYELKGKEIKQISKLVTLFAT